MNCLRYNRIHSPNSTGTYAVLFSYHEWTGCDWRIGEVTPSYPGFPASAWHWATWHILSVLACMLPNLIASTSRVFILRQTQFPSSPTLHAKFKHYTLTKMFRLPFCEVIGHVIQKKPWNKHRQILLSTSKTTHVQLPEINMFRARKLNFQLRYWVPTVFHWKLSVRQ